MLRLWKQKISSDYLDDALDKVAMSLLRRDPQRERIHIYDITFNGSGAGWRITVEPYDTLTDKGE